MADDKETATDRVDQQQEE